MLQVRVQREQRRRRRARRRRRSFAVNRIAISRIAPRSSTTASESRKTRALLGRFDAVRASTPRANAMSVATGIAQARSIPGVPQPTASATSAGTTMPPSPPGPGRIACLEPGKLADDQFAFEFETGDEEEQCQQPVLGPVPDPQVQMQQLRAEPEVAQPVYRCRRSGSSPRSARSRWRRAGSAHRWSPCGGNGRIRRRLRGTAVLHVILRFAATTNTVADQTSRRTEAHRSPR